MWHHVLMAREASTRYSETSEWALLLGAFLGLLVWAPVGFRWVLFYGPLLLYMVYSRGPNQGPIGKPLDCVSPNRPPTPHDPLSTALWEFPNIRGPHVDLPFRSEIFPPDTRESEQTQGPRASKRPQFRNVA